VKRISDAKKSADYSELCPRCFGENIKPRSFEGKDYWDCMDCLSSVNSVFELSGKDLDAARKKHKMIMKEISVTGVLPNVFEEYDDKQRKHMARAARLIVLLVLALVALIIYLLVRIALI